MQDPKNEIAQVVSLLTASPSPDVQRETFHQYWVPNAEFKHPLVHVKPHRLSTEEVIGIYQWYRILSPQIDIHVNEVVHDTERDKLLLDIVQTFHIRFSPFAPAPARLLVKLTLEKQDGLYYIASQEDFYHPDDFIALLLPPLVPAVRAALSVGSIVSNVQARLAQVLGIWAPQRNPTQKMK